MGRKRTPWLVGLMLATGVASLLLAAVTLSGFPASGESVAATPCSPLNALAILAGSLFLLAIEVARVASRRRRVTRARSLAHA